MSKKSSLCFLMILAAALGCSRAAQQNPPTTGQVQGQQGMGGPPPVMGVITSVGVDRFEIKKPDGSTQVVLVNNQTHIRQRQQQQQPLQPGQRQMPTSGDLQLEDLKVGDHVFVRGTPNADGQVLATGVVRATEEQFQRSQGGGGPGGPGAGGGGAGSGGWGSGGGGGFGSGGGGMAGARTGGDIQSINGNEIKVNGPFGEKIIVVNDQTTFAKEGHTFALKDLKVGDRIFAGGKEVDGKFVAAEVRSGHPGGGRGFGGGGMQGTRAGGEIQSIDGNEIRVNGPFGEKTIVVNDQTTFSKEGQTITLKDLKVGDRIFALGKEVDGKFVAAEVHSGRPGGGGFGRGGGQGPQN